MERSIVEILSSYQSRADAIYPIPQNLRPYLDCDVQRLDLGLSFDTEKYLAVAHHYFAKYVGYKKNVEPDRLNYLGLGLQYHDVTDPIFDGVGSLHLKDGGYRIQSDYKRLNEIGREYRAIFDSFAALGINLVRGRLLKSLPGQTAPHHYDLDYRIHIPLLTNPNAKAVFGAQKFHMDVGGAYLHNGYRLHSFENGGNQERIHLIFAIEGMTYDTGLNPLSPDLVDVLAPHERILITNPISEV